MYSTEISHSLVPCLTLSRRLPHSLYCLCNIILCAPLTCFAHGWKHDAHNGLLSRKECCLRESPLPGHNGGESFPATVGNLAEQFFASLGSGVVGLMSHAGTGACPRRLA